MSGVMSASNRLTEATECAAVLRALLVSTTTEQEVLLLEKLREFLKPICSVATVSEDECEREWLRGENIEDDNPFPSWDPSALFEEQRQLDQFTFYVFERRYGRTEFLINSNENTDDLDGISWSPSSPRAPEDTRFLTRLNELLDEHLKWFVAQPLSRQLLESHKYAVLQAHNMPVVRNHTCVHIMEWLKLFSDQGFSDQVFPLVKALIVSGITDVWSAIRNTCVARLAQILEHFTLHQAHIFYSELIKICHSKESSWQAVEGAVMGMTTLVRRFSWTGVMKQHINNNTKDDTAEYMLKFGKCEQSTLPSFILDSVHSVLYSLLAHPQLSIRDQATKAFSSILSRCEFQQAFSAFQEVVHRLCKGIQETSKSKENNTTELPHMAVLRSEFKFLEAYEAEGLLGVCVFLIKHIPPGYLLPTWPLYFSTFNLYLMHPASTVRQATSAVFKFLVAKESSSPVLLKLVLQGLAADWQVDTEILTSDLQQHVTSGDQYIQNTDNHRVPTPETRTRISPLPPKTSVASTSQARTASPSPDMAMVSNICDLGVEGVSHLASKRGSVSGKHPLLKNQRISMRNVQKLLEDNSSKATVHLVSQSWEWREGRLLAYELILKFLIANHIHYIFPTFALSRSSASASASVDENLIRRQSDTSPPSSQLKSSSFGAISSQMSNSFTPMTIKEDESVYIEAVSSSKQSPTCTREAWSRQPKRASSFSIVDDDAIRTRKLIRQYSVTCQTYPKRPFRPPKSNEVAVANSLLCQAANLGIDKNNSKPSLLVSGSISEIVKCLASPLGKIDQETTDGLLHYNKGMTSDNSSKDKDNLPEWAVHLELESLTCVLTQILFQTVECLGDSRWELRRMGQQLLPVVAETIRWFNMAPLAYLWDHHLTRENTLLCYGACIALRNSISHAGRLRYYLDQPPSTWKDPERCSRAAMLIVNEVKKGLQIWLSKVHGILKYSGYDKLSVVAMETIMLSHLYFHSSLGVDQKLEAEDQILTMLLCAFAYSFPDKPLSSSLKSFCHIQTAPFNIPLDGFLSCSTRPESTEKNAQQFGKHFFSEAHIAFKNFLKTNQVDKVVVVFPVLIHYIEVFLEETAICHSLVDGLQYILSRTKELTKTSKDRESIHDLVQTYFNYALIGVSEVIMSTKPLDLTTLRQLLEMSLKACEFLDQPTLTHIFRAISQRVDYEPDLLRLIGEESPSRTNTPDLYRLSNDIPTSPVDEPGIPVDEEDEESVDNVGLLRESVALDASHGSGRGTPRMAPQNDDEGSDMSDWDSWEEEEEDQSALIAVFADFLRNLQNMYEAKVDQEISVFSKQLQKCTLIERQAIASVMHS
ncbi:uncharacterized protein LOC116294568 isoform X2 [Actinia tenebrosa]|uniref:Uncharacterized protein LOC116294568 isoform X2 n=1 Tax=Actinia tenebrosa TaxID=6105 RepID=A0A6P8HR50_ACTTE|nr:uncharacterized protein LOC116294568 isoform X2 [Actinia tenebrosa]